MDKGTKRACERLEAFSDRWAPGQIVDEATGLTRDDLDLVLRHMVRTRNMVAIRCVDLCDLTPERIAQWDAEAAAEAAAA